MVARLFIFLLGLLSLMAIIAVVAPEPYIPNEMEDILMDEFSQEFPESPNRDDDGDEEEDEEEDEDDEEEGGPVKSRTPPEDMIAQNSNVQSLDAADFKAVVEAKKFALVEFYAPWCPHCQQLKPVYEKIQAQYADNSDILIAKVNADKSGNDAISQDLGVSGFPTLIFFRNGKNALQYKGPRTIQGISNFITKMTGKAVYEATSKDDLEKISAKALERSTEGDEDEEDDEEEEDEEEEDEEELEEEDEEGVFDFEKRAAGATAAAKDDTADLDEKQLTLILGSFPNVNSKEYQAFSDAAITLLGEQTFIHVKDSSILKKYGLKNSEPSLIALRKFSGKTFKFGGSLTNADEIIKFAKIYSQKIFLDKFDEITLSRNGPSSSTPVITFFYDRVSLAALHSKDARFDFVSQFKSIQSTFAYVAESYLGKYRFLFADISRNKRIAAVMKLKDSNTPEGIVIMNRLKMERFHPTNFLAPIFQSSPAAQTAHTEQLVQHITSAIAEFESGKLEAKVFSLAPGTRSPFAHNPLSESVHHLVAEEWDRFMQLYMERGQDVVVFIYSPGCPYCHEFSPIFRQISTFWNSRKNLPKIAFAEFDFIMNDFPPTRTAPEINIDEFPSFLFFPHKDTNIGGAIYNKDRPYLMQTDIVGADFIQELSTFYFSNKKSVDSDIHVELSQDLE